MFHNVGIALSHLEMQKPGPSKNTKHIIDECLYAKFGLQTFHSKYRKQNSCLPIFELRSLTTLNTHKKVSQLRSGLRRLNAAKVICKRHLATQQGHMLDNYVYQKDTATISYTDHMKKRTNKPLHLNTQRPASSPGRPRHKSPSNCTCTTLVGQLNQQEWQIKYFTYTSEDNVKL